MRNVRILHTQITDKIRVSSAAIWYPGLEYNPSPYYQYETWCFSDDGKQRSFQVIHGCHSNIHHRWIVDAIKIHKHIVRNLKKQGGN